MTVRIPVRLKPVRRENDIQREVLEALRKMGKFCLRLQSGKVKVKGGWMQLCPEGTPDIQVIERIKTPYECATHITWIEMKNAVGKQQLKQLEFMDSALARGERYIVARSLDDIMEVLK